MPHASFNLFTTMVSVAALELFLAAASRAQSLPEPTGSYPVGRITFQLVDDKREFVVQAWYPVQSGAEGIRAPWVPADQLGHEIDGVSGTGRVGRIRLIIDRPADGLAAALLRYLAANHKTLLQLEIDRERREASDTITDLRRRLDQSEQERRDVNRQLTALLTDQRPGTEAPAPNAGRGFWGRLRRKA